MSIDRKRLYKFPWSKADNPGAWIEVTDTCDFSCSACYRHRLEGHRSLDEVKKDILKSRELTNCGRITIAGGEPMIYPHILEAVEFIARNGMQPVVFTNGAKLDRTRAAELKNAGVFQIFIHVDSGQNRPGWEGKSETELNELRQYYAEILRDAGGIQCGFNTTITRRNLAEVPAVVGWVRRNISLVQNVSLIAVRGLDLSPGKRYMAAGEEIDLSAWRCGSDDASEISLTSRDIFETIEGAFPGSTPSAYLGGTADPGTLKFLIILYLGSSRKIHGVVGHKAVELNEIILHLRNGRYVAGIKNPRIGRKIFLLSFVDREVRKAFFRYIGDSLKRPARLFDPISLQCINVQQPGEILDGEVNLCDGCLNQMVYKGELIPSCKLDEYRLFGGPLTEIREQTGKAGSAN